MRCAKIVCTLGPATSSEQGVASLVAAGMDVARINASHGEHAEHEAVYAWVRKAAAASGRAVGVLVDLQGPKIRCGRFAGGPITLAPGEPFTITTDDVAGDQTRVSTTYPGLVGDVHAGDKLLIDDGKVTLEATSVTGTDVNCRVLIGGAVSNNKGINLPGVAVSVPALSAKDEDDLRWALRMGADMVALSFVREGTDIDRVHQIMDQEGVHLPVIAKIEKPQAVANLAEIIAAFDAVMVARGDLGVELPFEEVPLVQKLAIELSRRAAKPVIVATQVLESMIENPRPTRAEVSDCANAVLDGADAIMLSGETSVGAWPTQAVAAMARIIESTEAHGLERIPALGTRPHTVGGAVTAAAAEIGELLGAKYLVTFTESGDSARRLCRVRPKLPMLAFTARESTRAQLALSWGVEAHLVAPVAHTDQMAGQVDEALLGSGRCVAGDTVVIVAGSPVGTAGSTNALHVHLVGDARNTVSARDPR